MRMRDHFKHHQQLSGSSVNSRGGDGGPGILGVEQPGQQPGAAPPAGAGRRAHIHECRPRRWVGEEGPNPVFGCRAGSARFCRVLRRPIQRMGGGPGGGQRDPALERKTACRGGEGRGSGDGRGGARARWHHWQQQCSSSVLLASPRADAPPRPLPTLRRRIWRRHLAHNSPVLTRPSPRSTARLQAAQVDAGPGR